MDTTTLQIQSDLQDVKTALQSHSHDGVTGTQVLFQNLVGLIETVTTTPTNVPKTIYDQVKIYKNSTTYRLYWYDNVNNAWRYAEQPAATTTYSGAVASGGTAGTPFPSGWSVAKNSTGNYTVTHNLGTSSYVVVATIKSGGKQILNSDISNNTFDILTYNASGSAVDGAFGFILIVT